MFSKVAAVPLLASIASASDADVTTYPTAVANAVAGKVTVVDSTDKVGTQTHLTGLEKSLDTTGKNGVHVHVGMTCESSGGHYWTPATDPDPWNDAKYTTDANGASSETLLVAGSGYDAAGMAGHAVVVHDAAGARVACGVIGKSPCQAFCSQEAITCAGAYADNAACLSACATWAPGSTGEARKAEDSLACRAYHQSVAMTDATSATTHCPHTKADGGSVCVDNWPDKLYAVMSRYPDREAPASDVRGSVHFSANSGNVDVKIMVSGLEKSLDTTGKNGVHVHVGMTCESSGAHYWTPTTGPDPWNEAKYTTDVDGKTSNPPISVDGNTLGYTAAQLDGHAVVVHDAAGVRVACGVIGKSPCQAFCSQEAITCASTYADNAACLSACATWAPGSTGEARKAEDSLACRAYHQSVAMTDSASATTHCPHTAADGGTVCVFDDMIAGSFAIMSAYPSSAEDAWVRGTVAVVPVVEVTLAVTGLEKSLDTTGKNGVHVHVGMTCESSGGHYWTPATAPDVWNEAKYTTDAEGVSSETLLVAGSGYDAAGMAGHAVVIHNAAGARVACGVLGKSPCQAFCSQEAITCASTYADNAACLSACATWAKGTTNTTRVAENSLACRAYHQSVAMTNAASATTHCPHTAADGGTVCVAALQSSASKIAPASLFSALLLALHLL